MQAAARDRLDRALQFGEREFARHHLEDDGTVFELGAQPGNRRRENAAVVELHRFAEIRQ